MVSRKRKNCQVQILKRTKFKRHRLIKKHECRKTKKWTDKSILEKDMPEERLDRLDRFDRLERLDILDRLDR